MYVMYWVYGFTILGIYCSTLIVTMKRTCFGIGFVSISIGRALQFGQDFSSITHARLILFIFFCISSRCPNLFDRLRSKQSYAEYSKSIDVYVKAGPVMDVARASASAGESNRKHPHRPPIGVVDTNMVYSRFNKSIQVKVRNIAPV